MRQSKPQQLRLVRVEAETVWRTYSVRRRYVDDMTVYIRFPCHQRMHVKTYITKTLHCLSVSLMVYHKSHQTPNNTMSKNHHLLVSTFVFFKLILSHFHASRSPLPVTISCLCFAVERTEPWQYSVVRRSVRWTRNYLLSGAVLQPWYRSGEWRHVSRDLLSISNLTTNIIWKKTSIRNILDCG